MDTIVIRVHNLKNYPAFVKALLLNSKRKMNYSSGKIKVKDLDSLYFHLHSREYVEYDKVLYDVKGNVMTSGNYLLGYRFPFGKEEAGFVELNFSVPKFIYGTNIFQFVEHKHVSDIYGHDFTSLESNLFDGFYKLRHFLKVFLHKPFKLEKPIKLTDIEIRRIDICFNQIFDSKDDALRYLRYQKLIKKPRVSKKKLILRDPETGIFFNNMDFSYKIYHKGTEYKLHDRPEHQRINKSFGKDIFPINKLQLISDRVLRYELTVRNSLMSKIYWRKIFLKNSEFSHFKKKYLDIDRIYKSRFLRYDTNYQITKDDNGVNYYNKIWNRNIHYNKDLHNFCSFYQGNFHDIVLIQGVTDKERQLYKKWKKLRDIRCRFFMDFAEIPNKNVKNIFTDDISLDVMFGSTLFKHIVNKFVKYFYHFEIKERTSYSVALEQLERYNQRVEFMNKNIPDGLKAKKRMYLGKFKAILSLLEFYPMQELIDRGMIDRSTIYRYKKKFEMLKINIDNSSIGKINHCNDFTSYHYEIAKDFRQYIKF